MQSELLKRNGQARLNQINRKGQQSCKLSIMENWIKITDQKPPLESCFIAFLDYGDGSHEIAIGAYGKYNGMRVMHHPNPKEVAEYISYWMPLPKYPVHSIVLNCK